MEAAMTDKSKTPSPRFRAGEWVQVRTKEEILSTLDAKGQLDELPFMPEMLRYCGTPRAAGAPRDFRQAYSTVSPYVCPADRPGWQGSWILLRTLRVESGQRYNGVVRSGKRVCWF